MEGRCSTPRRSSPRSDEGFTLVELLVSLTVVLAVSAAALALSLAGRRAYEADRARTRLNQSLRAGMDLLATDVRQAGERLDSGFPALEVVDGGAGAPDELVVRRNLMDTVLRVCGDVTGSTLDIPVAVASSPPPGCAPVPDDDADGWPENLEAWRDRRLDEGASLRVFVYDPIARLGEFFDYVSEDNVALTVSAASGTSWDRDYLVANQPRLYVLEERRYQLDADMLQIVVNEDTSGPLRVVQDIADFRLRVVLEDFSTRSSFGPADDWKEIRSVEATLTGDVTVGDRRIERSWTVEMTPRNVLNL